MGVSTPAPPAPTALRRVGMFGGAFDPPHNAHVALARAAIDTLALDRLHIVPTGDAWHKSRPLSSAAHRLAMCRLAFGGLPRAVVDARELRRSGPSYTIDTLTELQAQYPGAALFLQIGADQASAFHTWRQARRIAEIATISIAVRDPYTRASGQFDPQNPLPGLPPGLARVRILALPPAAHSSTQIRQQAAAGQPLRGQVPPAVARYIAQHHLYQTLAA